MGDARSKLVVTGLERFENQRGLWMTDGFVGFIGKQVLFRYIGDIAGLIIFSQKVIERLILPGANLLWNRQPPFLGIGEHGVHIENNPAERENPMFDHLADGEFREPCIHEPTTKVPDLNWR